MTSRSLALSILVLVGCRDRDTSTASADPATTEASSPIAAETQLAPTTSKPNSVDPDAPPPPSSSAWRSATAWQVSYRPHYGESGQLVGATHHYRSTTGEKLSTVTKIIWHDSDVTGALSVAAARTYLAAAMPALEECYERASFADHGMKGGVSWTFDLAADGRVDLKTFKRVGSSMYCFLEPKAPKCDTPALSACFTQAWTTATAPPSSGPSHLKVTVDFQRED